MNRPLRNPRSSTAHLVGHAHIDLSWLWRWEETVDDVAVRTFRGTLAQMAKVPGLTFAQSQAAIYEAIEKSHPQIFEEIRRRVQDGTWIPVGGMWTEPDLNMPDGESLARQLLYGKRYFIDRLGVDVTVGWSPDAFGHSWQLPQILGKAGIRSYVLERCAPERAPFFLWEGKDGSRVLGFVPPGWYLVSLKNGLAEVLGEAATQTPLRDFMILYGEGDHGGGPRDSDVEAYQKFREAPDQPNIVFGQPERFFAKIASAGVDLPVIRKELNFAFPGCYTTQAGVKKWNRKMERLLLGAERFSALAVASGYRDYYPERDIDEAWKIVLRNQFHDILDGSSIGPVYEEALEFYRQAEARGRRALDFSLETILNAVDTRGEGVPLAVFNPLPWRRTGPVESDLRLPPGTVAVDIRDPWGRILPVQVLERKREAGETRLRIAFLAADIPPCGYRVYRAIASPESIETASESPLKVTGSSLENSFLRAELDPGTGWLTSLFDKRSKREVLAGPANVLQAIPDEPESMSAWELGLRGEPQLIGRDGARVEVVESGPVRGVIRVRTRFRNSDFVQDLVLYAGLAGLDGRMSFDWQERNWMVKAAFPASVRAAGAEFEIPFGSITRPADGTEVPALRWVDVSGDSEGWGLSLLNDCKYGFDVRDSTMRMSVVRGPTYPDPEADRGRHDLSFSLYPHSGGWREADTVRRGYEFNDPLIVRTGMIHPGSLPAEKGFFEAGPANVVLSTLKMESGYNSRALVVRVYEATGRPTAARISFPWPVTAEEADLIERPFPGGLRLDSSGPGHEIVFPLRSCEIKTFRVVKK